MRYCANHALVLVVVSLLVLATARIGAGVTPGKFDLEGEPREGLVYFGFADFNQEWVARPRTGWQDIG